MQEYAGYSQIFEECRRRRTPVEKIHCPKPSRRSQSSSSTSRNPGKFTIASDTSQSVILTSGANSLNSRSDIIMDSYSPLRSDIDWNKHYHHHHYQLHQLHHHHHHHQYHHANESAFHTPPHPTAHEHRGNNQQVATYFPDTNNDSSGSFNNIVGCNSFSTISPSSFSGAARFSRSPRQVRSKLISCDQQQTFSSMPRKSTCCKHCGAVSDASPLSGSPPLSLRKMSPFKRSSSKNSRPSETASTPLSSRSYFSNHFHQHQPRTASHQLNNSFSSPHKSTISTQQHESIRSSPSRAPTNQHPQKKEPEEKSRHSQLLSPTSSSLSKIASNRDYMQKSVAETVAAHFSYEAGSFALLFACSRYRTLPCLPGADADVALLCDSLVAHGYETSVCINPSADEAWHAVSALMRKVNDSCKSCISSSLSNCYSSSSSSSFSSSSSSSSISSTHCRVVVSWLGHTATVDGKFRWLLCDYAPSLTSFQSNAHISFAVLQSMLENEMKAHHLLFLMDCSSNHTASFLFRAKNNDDDDDCGGGVGSSSSSSIHKTIHTCRGVEMIAGISESPFDVVEVNRFGLLTKILAKVLLTFTEPIITTNLLVHFIKKNLESLPLEAWHVQLPSLHRRSHRGNMVFFPLKSLPL